MNIALVKLSSIGDVVHALPVAAALRAALPQARIAWIVERREAAVLRGNAALSEVVPVDTRHLTAPQSLRMQVSQHLADMGMRGVYNQVMRGMLHDGLLDHIRLVRNRHPDVDILLIEPRADDEKMFFHELMSFSARLMVMQHGYESVSNGLQDTWGYLRRILPRHGIHITRHVVDRKPSQVPPVELRR